MKKILTGILLISLLLTISSCKKGNERIVKLKTEYGNITIKLYNETPLHRDNFIKLTEDGFYNDLLFHRVINEFMIQGGDPDSKEAEAGKMLGNGDVGYKIDAEFKKEIIHKKGVLAAAREGDDVNPEKASSGCQFYIVQGQIFTNEELNKLERKVNQRLYSNIYRNLMIDAQEKSMETNSQIDFNKLSKELAVKAKELFAQSDTFKLTNKQREVYSTIGGTPHLDGNYTVFGEIIEGLEIIDKIAAIETDKNDRPLEDIRMKIKVIK